jgi:dynein intermediate chain, cytosolic
VGTQSSNNIVSISNDGKVCQWAQGKLNEPIVNFGLQIKVAQEKTQQSKAGAAKEDDKEDLSVTSLDFPEGETDKFYVGCDDYCAYQCSFHQLGDGQHLSRQFYNHSAPVTRINLHPRASQSEYAGRSDLYQDLLLTSSIDWTVKLWSPKIRHAQPLPLFTFENAQEYIYDVEWSPVHPAIFACCDGDGFLEIWDLNRDTEGPIAVRQSSKRTALNCLKWNADGRKIAVGDSEGYVNLWSLDKEIG